MAKRRLRLLTLRQKLKIIDKIDGGVKKIELARKHNIAPSTLTSIMKMKEKLIAKSNTSENMNIKKMRNCKNVALETALLTFIKQARSVNIPLSGLIVQSKARIYAQKMGLSTFRASDGWLTKFKRKHNLRFKTMSGESADVDMHAVNEWKKQLPNILKDYEPEDIFNADETGLFFKCLPNKTLEFKNEKCHGGKLSKQRITVMVGANSTGTEKLKPFVIGKSQKPRCFKNIRQLPVKYKANKKAWMTGMFFEEYMKELDKDFQKQNRKVLFFVDNCPAHPKDLVKQLKAINLVFLEPNTTSKTQPMDAGVIKNFKKHYHEKLVEDLIEQFETTSTLKEVTLLDAINHWEKVTATTIKNCFKYVGIEDYWTEEDTIPIRDFVTASNIEKSIIDDNTNDETGKESDSLNGKWERVKNLLGIDYSFEEYVDVDKGVLTEKILSDDEVVALVMEDKLDDQTIQSKPMDEHVDETKSIVLEADVEVTPAASLNDTAEIEHMLLTTNALEDALGIIHYGLCKLNAPRDIITSYYKIETFLKDLKA